MSNVGTHPLPLGVCKILKTKDTTPQNIDSKGFVGKFFGISGLRLTVGCWRIGLEQAFKLFIFSWLQAMGGLGSVSC
jgi:hypothetical protein